MTQPGSGPRRPTPRRLAIAALSALVVCGGALGVAAVLDDPAAEGPRDAAPIVAGVVNPAGRELTGGREQALPPLALIPSTPLGAEFANTTPEQQVVRLRDQIATEATADRYIALGRAYMALQDVDEARSAFQTAASLAPGDPEPRVGLTMLPAVVDSQGMSAASRGMDELAEGFPDSQVVSFNRGWLALYRQDVPTVRSAWQRTRAQGPDTSLGRLAAALLRQLDGRG